MQIISRGWNSMDYISITADGICCGIASSGRKSCKEWSHN